MAEKIGEHKLPEIADVVVIGAGPAGSVMTKSFAMAGMSVVCLDQGDWPDYSTSRNAGEEYEIVGGNEWSPLPNVRRGVGDYPIDENDADISALLWNGVGGSAMLYAAQWQRNMPSDFRVRSLDGVADDWPMSYEELIPYYKQAEKDFAIAGLNGDPAVPGTDYPMSPTPIGKSGSLLAKAHNNLGWHWWPGANGIATREYGRLKPSTRRGASYLGNGDQAKSTVDVTHWPDIARHRNAYLLTRSTVARIETDSFGKTSGVIYFDAEGTERRQKAKIVVLAASGIGTPRLLLMSANEQHPDGLANASGLVGKRLMMHPYSAVVGTFDQEIGTTQGAYGHTLYSMEFYESDESRGFVRGAKWGLMPTGGAMEMTKSFPWGENRDLWGENFNSTLRERLNHSVTWGIIAEDLPEETNRVELSTDLVDAHGLPAPKIVYETSENSRKLLAYHVDRATESLLEAGAKKITVAPHIRNTGWHLLGTAKMGASAEDSVVDHSGRAHSVPNLYIVDGSTWPTSAGVNPTATVVAMAMRTAEMIISGRNS
ncbi:GMC family oxidoreductase [Glutamicibacter sp. MNS18]|uniref:GMC family oxidoreductase n=1 Tax=Glutamicibacter sp. MNS18 TaxID=2989817 RepID=UPI002235DEF1|nr:GMC family oxidoreductase [Glutamicibacter sp. MNS18]MCW4466412.1 GMC family oxidoreductase [Glutamicibacter sp. MNS18]